MAWGAAWLALCLLLVHSTDARPGEIGDRFQAAREERFLGTPRALDHEQAKRAVVRVYADKEHDVDETGSGFYLWRQEGITYILTANHVVEEAQIEVEFYGLPNRRFPAVFLGADESLDLAVISVRHASLEITGRLKPFRTGRAEDSGQLAKNSRTGLLVQDVTPELARKYSVAGVEGALVTTVAKETAAESAGLRPGDLIVEVDGTSVRDVAELIARARTVGVGGVIQLTLVRAGREQSTSLQFRESRTDTMRPIFTIGHSVGQDWVTRAGYIVSHEFDDSLSITGDLVDGGNSGGPVLDTHLRVIGVAVRDGPETDTAIRIERALPLVEALRVPSAFWLTEEFCSRLHEVLEKATTEDLESLKTGAGWQPAPPWDDNYRWWWDSPLDLSGRGTSYVKEGTGSGASIFYEAEMVHADLDEVDLVSREIARSVKECIPDSDVNESGEFCLKIIYKRGGFWGDVNEVEICTFHTLIVIRIKRQ